MSRIPRPDPEAGELRALARGRWAHGPAIALLLALLTGALLGGPWGDAAVQASERGGGSRGTLLALHSGRASTPAQKQAKRVKVRAACLYNFIKYANFPRSAFKRHKKNKDPIVILIVGKDPFGKVIDDMLRKKKAHGRTFVIKRRRTVPVRIDAHLVYAAGLKAKDEALLVKRTLGQPCLLVGDDKAFPKGGGFIRLYEEKGKTRFDVDLARQKDTGVKLDVELLKLARVVKGKE